MIRIYKLFPAYSVPEKWSEYLKNFNTFLAQNRFHFLGCLFFLSISPAGETHAPCMMPCSWQVWCLRDDKPLSDSLKHSNSDLSLYISNLRLHLILSTAPIINYLSTMPFSKVMQSSSSTIALQLLTSQWSLDSDDYHIHYKNHHRC